MAGDATLTPPELFGVAPLLVHATGLIVPACRSYDPSTIRRRAYQVIAANDPDWYLRTLTELIVTLEVDRRSCIRTNNRRTLAVMDVTASALGMVDRYCPRSWWRLLTRSTWLSGHGPFVRRAVSVHANVEARYGGDGVPHDDGDAALRARTDLAALAGIVTRLAIGGPVGLYCELVAAGYGHDDAVEVAGLLGVDLPA